MATKPTDHIFHVYFEGLIDESTDTLRRVKAACIGDLNLTVEETARLLTGEERLVLETSDKALAKGHSSILIAAGAKAVMKQASPSEPADSESEESEHHDAGFEFEFDLNSHPPISSSPKQQKVWSLEEEEKAHNPSLSFLEESRDPPHEAPTEVSEIPTQPLTTLLGFEIATKEELSTEPEASLPDPNPTMSLPDAPLFAFDDGDGDLQIHPETVEELPIKIEEEDSFDLTIEPVEQPESPSSSSTTRSVTLEVPPSLFTTEEEVPQRIIENQESPPSSLKPIPLPSHTLTMPSLSPSESVDPEPALEHPPISYAHANARNSPLSITTTLLSIGIGGAILVAVNFLYHMHRAPPAPTALDMTSEEMEDDPAHVETEKPAKPPTDSSTVNPSSSLNRFNIENSDAKRSIYAICNKSEGSFSECSLRLRGVPPPPLTAEEVAHHTPPKPWIARIEAEKFPLVDNKGCSQGWGYIHLEEQSTRMPAQICVKIRNANEGKMLSLHISSNPSTASAENFSKEGSILQIEQTPGTNAPYTFEIVDAITFME